MKTVIFYRNGEPMKRPDGRGKNHMLHPFDLFTETEADKIYTAAGHMERFFEDMFRNESVNEAAQELFEACKNIKNPDAIRKLRIKRYVRSYILEADIFIRHWERYMISKGTSADNAFKTITRRAFDENESYALLCILRNYLVHSNDVIHGIHIGFDGVRIWADRDIVLNDIKMSSTKRELLEKQHRKMDLFRIVQESVRVLDDIHEKLLDTIITEKLKQECAYLVDMCKRTVMINSDFWFVAKITGNEWVSGAFQPGVGMDYYILNWKGYHAIYDKIIYRSVVER